MDEKRFEEISDLILDWDNEERLKDEYPPSCSFQIEWVLDNILDGTDTPSNKLLKRASKDIGVQIEELIEWRRQFQGKV